MAEYDRMSPEFALVAALETVPALRDRVTALQPKKDVRPPFAFYSSAEDDEEQALDGRTGLQQYSGTLHLVAGSFRGLQLLCARARLAVQEMQGEIYSTPENDDEAVPRGRILVETATMTQSSPDLFEANVGYYRRMYSVRLCYQTEEIFDDTEEEVISV